MAPVRCELCPLTYHVDCVPKKYVVNDRSFICERHVGGKRRPFFPDALLVDWLKKLKITEPDIQSREIPMAAIGQSDDEEGGAGPSAGKKGKAKGKTPTKATPAKRGAKQEKGGEEKKPKVKQEEDAVSGALWGARG